MKITTIDEIKELDAGECVCLCSGQLISLYDYKDGNDGTRDWSFQRGKLKDRTGEMEILFKDREALARNWRGKKIVIEAHKGDRGFTGVYAEDDEYLKKKGKPYQIIKVTKSADIYLEDDQSNGDAGDERGDERRSSRSSSRRREDDDESDRGRREERGSSRSEKRREYVEDPPPRKKESAPPPDPEAMQARAVLDAKKSASRLGNLCCIAMDAVHAIIEPYYKARFGEMPPEQRQAFIGHLFGDLQRAGADVNLPVARMVPSGAAAEPPKKQEPPPKKDPPPPAEPPPPRREPPPADRHPLGLTPPQPDDDEIPF